MHDWVTLSLNLRNRFYIFNLRFYLMRYFSGGDVSSVVNRKVYEKIDLVAR
jgi:hypothetical protein